MLMSRNRAGTTLTELLVTLVVLSIVGTGMIRLMTSQSRFFNEQEGTASARRVARSGLNLLFTDLRRVETDSSVILATPSVINVRLPYWTGISCGTDAGLSGTHISMPPIDSLTLADAGYTGYGWIDTNGDPHFRAGSNFGAGDPTVCAGRNVAVVAHPRARVMKVTPAILGAPEGTPVFVWQDVMYWFGSSISVPGQRGLFRTITTKVATEEIAAPFDNTAAFAYYVPGSGTPVSNPAPGTPIVGIDLDLIGLNERNITNGRTQRAPFETALYFKNR